MKPSPRWKPLFVPSADFDDEDGPPKLGSAKRKPLLTIREHEEGSESDSSMPSLQEVSDSDSDDLSDSEDEDEESDGEDSEESGYDTDGEDELRELCREAMNTAVASPFFTSQQGVPGDEDPLDMVEDDNKGNPFLKLLGSLRGECHLTLRLQSTRERFCSRTHVCFEHQIERAWCQDPKICKECCEESSSTPSSS